MSHVFVVVACLHTIEDAFTSDENLRLGYDQTSKKGRRVGDGRSVSGFMKKNFSYLFQTNE
jgi:hypothetical protein